MTPRVPGTTPCAAADPRRSGASPGPVPAHLDDMVALIQRLLAQYLLRHRPDFSGAIGRDMSFDYLGLDSLARVELLAALDGALGSSLDPTAAYDFVTVQALAEFAWSSLRGEALDLTKTLEI